MAYLSFVPASVGPAKTPEGLWTNWNAGPDTSTDADNQVVINTADGGIVFVFCYDDNRNSVAFVKYYKHPPETMLMQPETPVEITGCRYPWALGLDNQKKIVTISGQGNKLTTATFQELGIE